jgi:hypothetical protein
VKITLFRQEVKFAKGKHLLLNLTINHEQKKWWHQPLPAGKFRKRSFETIVKREHFIGFE